MSLATLLVLADGRLPSGGHAHSGGLEAAVSSGRLRDIPGLSAFLHGRLATAGLVAASFAAATCACLTRTSPLLSTSSTLPPSASRPLTSPFPAPPCSARPSSAALVWVEVGEPSAEAPHPAAKVAVAELDAGLDARTPSPALRKASRAQGRALLRAGRAMWPAAGPSAEPSECGPSAEPSECGPLALVPRDAHHPVALGAVAAAAGLSPLDAAVAAAHGAVTGPASAGVRLLGLDPYRVHALLAALAPDIDRIAADAAARADDSPDDLPAAGAPLLDIGAEHHATWEVRLFAS